MNATLTRTKTGDSGTFGSVTLADGSTYVTGELPWRDNRHGESCIPAGTYRCDIYQSPTHGTVYQVMDVPDRSNIEIHSANWFGDKSMGLRADMLGCIGLGRSLGVLSDQQAILQSAVAVAEFMAKQQGEPFELNIVEDYAS